MKILVTGGAGFIGSNVADALIAAGHDVAIVDNLATGSLANVNSSARFYEADIIDHQRLEEILDAERPDVVSHHAAQVNIRVSVARPLFDTSVNVLGTVSVLEASALAGVKRFIFVSSGGAVYGEPLVIPTTEDTPASPISAYGAAKLSGEHYCNVYRAVRGLPFVILRYANVYGPRQSPEGEAGVTSIFARLMLQRKPCTIFGDGSKTRDYVHVHDIAQANLLALDKGEFGVFNIATGRQVSDQQVFDSLAAAAGYTEPANYAPFRAGEVSRSALDCTRAREVLGWAPTINFDEGVASVVDYHRADLGLA
jgi:UDP-glucose 4-epimerase